MTVKSYTALGLMSGTSLDGIDAAFLKTDGEHIHSFGPSVYRPYSNEERAVLKAATQEALNWQFKGAPPNFTQALSILHCAHIEIIETLCADHPKWTDELELIGFHGQTVLHHPPTHTQIGRTLQLGEGQVLADHFNRPCVYDFRTADMDAGGQGAPLAPVYHKALCAHAKLGGITAVLNLGGVGNVTVIDDDKIWASDTGPANGPLDQWMQKHGHDYDKDGAASLIGGVNFALIDQWLNRDFFKRKLPRSADRYDFDVIGDMIGLSLEDGAATLAAFCAASVRVTLKMIDVSPDRIILCGGGRHNRAIRLMLSENCRVPVISAEDMGWDSDMIEAQAFAFLAVRSLKGLPLSFPNTTGVTRPIKGGCLIAKS